MPKTKPATARSTKPTLLEIARLRGAIKVLEERLKEADDLPAGELRMELEEQSVVVSMAGVLLKKNADGSRSKSGQIPWARVSAFLLAQFPAEQRATFRDGAVRAACGQSDMSPDEDAEFRVLEESLKRAVSENAGETAVKGSVKVEVLGGSVK